MMSNKEFRGTMMKTLKQNLLIILSITVMLFTATGRAEILSTTYYHNDLLGSPIAATDENGDLKWTEQYRPYGERIQNDPAAEKNTRWYTGHAHDQDTGLTYMGARYYDPVVGRFMAMDPVGFSEGNVHSFNRYAYANNNPYRFVDPDGRESASLEWYSVLGLGIAVNSKNNGDGTARAELLFRFGLGGGGGYAYDENGTISEHAARGDTWIARTVSSIEGGVAILGVGPVGGISLPSGNAFNENDNGNPYGKLSIERPFTADTSGKTSAKLSMKHVVEIGYSWDTIISSPVTDPRNSSFVDENIAP